MSKVPEAISGNLLKIKVCDNFLQGLEYLKTDSVQRVKTFWVTFTANDRKYCYDFSIKTETNKKTPQN